MRRDAALPGGLGWLGLAAGVLLIWIYLARLIVMDPTRPILLYPVLLNGFILLPAFYAWLGWELRRSA
jgi:hypothetical protein